MKMTFIHVLIIFLLPIFCDFSVIYLSSVVNVPHRLQINVKTVCTYIILHCSIAKWVIIVNNYIVCHIFIVNVLYCLKKEKS